MTQTTEARVLHNRHTGERLELRRVARHGQIWLELKGTLPPRRQGPPLHVHYQETEEGQVIAGTLSAVVDGRRIRVGADTPVLPFRSQEAVETEGPHRQDQGKRDSHPAIAAARRN